MSDFVIPERRDRFAPPEHPKGSISNPLTEADLPFDVPEDGCYWIAVEGKKLTQLPWSPAGSVLAFGEQDDG